MSKTRATTVQIINPLLGGSHYTSRKSALQFVRRGLAVSEANNTVLRFLDQDRRSDEGRNIDRIGGHFWWRIGRTGGFAQGVGSIFYPMSKASKLDKNI
jgi:hypothetical protein